MRKIGFSAEKYIEEQTKYIRERINHRESFLQPARLTTVYRIISK